LYFSTNGTRRGPIETRDWFVWNTLPDRAVFAGAAIIVACGLYLLRAERVHVEAEHP
jgi:hypothetical protein